MEIKKYMDLRQFLLKSGFKCIDLDSEGNEVFQKDKIKFSIAEVKRPKKLSKDNKLRDSYIG